ncbi:caspase family protein [Bacteroidota bacterium]
MRAKLLVLIAILVGFQIQVLGQTVTGRSNALFLEVNAQSTIAAAEDITITWLYPDNPTVIVDDRSVTIKAGILGGDQLREVKLYINNLPTISDRGFSVEDEESQKFDEYLKKDLQLSEGLNEIKVVALDSRGQEQIFTRNITLKLPEMAARTDRALIIGTDEYDDWGDLTNPVFDATTIDKELSEFYGFETELVLNPTKREVLNKIREYAKKSYLPDDQLLIFLAGHGQFDDVFTEGYLVAKDSRMHDEAKESYISHSTLRTYVNNIPSNHTFIIMDVCYGGTFDQAIARSGSRGGDDIYNELTKTEFIKRKLRFKTRRYLTSGGKQYVPDGRAGHHSPFARKFLEALRNYGGQDKILTLNEVTGYVETINPEPRYGEFGDNEPGSDFVFVAQ